MNHRDELSRLRAVGWEESIRYDYPTLTANSIVWDIGAFTGEFAERIHSKYGCEMVLFEMVPSKIDMLMGKWPGFVTMPFGLSGENRSVLIKDDDNCTSTLSEGEIEVGLRRISEILWGPVDLMKINIEGDEYSLLEDLYGSGKMPLVDIFQIQFHDFVIINDGQTVIDIPNAADRYAEAQAQLNETHELQWSWPWVWESWTRRTS